MMIHRAKECMSHLTLHTTRCLPVFLEHFHLVNQFSFRVRLELYN
jgi:hypothetical protein